MQCFSTEGVLGQRLFAMLSIVCLEYCVGAVLLLLLRAVPGQVVTSG